MYFSAILAALAAFITLTAAGRDGVRPDANSPTASTSKANHTVPAEWRDHPHHPSNAHSDAKRSGALGVYECKFKNWYGPCTWTKADGGACHNWIYGPGGSMGPDYGLTCTIYVDFNCKNKHLDGFAQPGIPDYQQNSWLISNQMSNGPMSYKCQKVQ